MGPLNAIYSWSSVKALYACVFSMNLAGILALTLLVTWAIRFQRGFGDYLNLLTSGDGDAWPMMVVIAGIICTPAYILGIKFHFALKLEDDTVDAHGVNRLLFLHALICLISGILVAILNAAYLARPSVLQQKTRNGLLVAIENYGNDMAVKERVDSMQTNLECCGDESYKDWFRLSWINQPMEDAEEDAGPRLEGQLTTQARMDDSAFGDVPFSCCSNEILKPCVHYDLLKPSAVYNYDPKHLTIAVVGCRSKIVKRADLIKRYLVGYLVLLSIYQVVLSLLSRLLQTAHSNRMYIGPGQNSYHVWIFCKRADTTDDKPRTRHNVDKKLMASSRTTKRALVTSSASSDNEEDLLLNGQRKRNTKESKFLKKISSKIASVKRKGLPLFKGRERKRTPARSEDSSIPELPPLPPLQSISIELEEQERKGSSETASKVSQERMQMEMHSDDGGLGKNTGRYNRRKVLERFVQISQATNQPRYYREHGGADKTSAEERSPRSDRSRKRFHSVINPADAYNRFRGTLQHTLARREVTQARNRRGLKACSRVYHPKEVTHARTVADGSSRADTKINSLISKLRCKDVAPSYRLLANLQAGRCPIMKAPTVPPPPPPPPLPELLNPWVQRMKPSSTESRECNICHRPIQRTTRITRSRVSDADDCVP